MKSLVQRYLKNGFLFMRSCLPLVEIKSINNDRHTVSASLISNGVPTTNFNLSRSQEVSLLLTNCEITACYEGDAAVDTDGKSGDEEVNFEKLLESRKALAASGQKLNYCEALIEMYKPNSIVGIVIPHEEMVKAEPNLSKFITARHSFKTAFNIDFPYAVLKDNTEITEVCEDETSLPQSKDTDNAKYLGKLSGFLSARNVDYIESAEIKSDGIINARFRISETDCYMGLPLQNLTLSHEEIDDLVEQKEMDISQLRAFCESKKPSTTPQPEAIKLKLQGNIPTILYP